MEKLNNKPVKCFSEKCLNKQIMFMVLEFIYSNRNKDEYCNNGFKLEDFVSEFESNRPLWESVNNGKKWEDRINWILSDLSGKSDNNHYWLDRDDNERIFYWSVDHSQLGLEELVGALTEDLELTIDFGFQEYSLTLEEKVQKVKDGSAAWEILSHSLNSKGKQKRRLILTEQQTTRLAVLSLYFNFSD